ncbi:proline-rich protein 15-like protein A [Leucoraja erinacea]|uniref:proline-rich protein 15-like protein A n=1 Tax=Leucoraja erinaceus TaxID=7782 RepID=UPI002456F0F0|nr:proline-rich protein 15-like protein A [Leucoraja erinacea]
MGDGAPQAWWKFAFMRKKGGSKVLSELAVEPSNTDSSDREARGDPQLEARLEKIVDKSTKGRHVRVSHSGRFKEKKKVRSSLSENPGFYSQTETASSAEP